MKKNFLSRLRGKKPKPASSSDNVSTIPLDDYQVDKLKRTGLKVEPQQVIYGCGQSSGKQRDHNEDCIFALSITSAGETSSSPMGLFIIADGMGGHQLGEVASSTAARTLASYLIGRFHPYLVDPTTSLDEPLQDVMRSAIYEAQNAVTKTAPGSGTTLTVALVLGQQITFGHVGDSRAYAIHPQGGIQVLTRDHSLVKRLEELGQISSEEAAIHPQRNVLYRALGQGDMLDPDIFTAPFPQQGYLLLCSDGLWGMLPDKRIYNIVIKAQNLQNACQELVAGANEAGGPDNISVIIVQMTS